MFPGPSTRWVSLTLRTTARHQWRAGPPRIALSRRMLSQGPKSQKDWHHHHDVRQDTVTGIRNMFEKSGVKLNADGMEKLSKWILSRDRMYRGSIRKQYLVAGAVVGVGILAFGVYMALGESTIEFIIAAQANMRFSAMSNFADRVAVYHSIPDINVPVPLDPSEGELSNMIQTDSPLLATWLESVENAIDSLESSYLLTVRERLQKELIAEALKLPTLHERVAAIQAVLSPCAEKEALLERELNLAFDDVKGGWIDAAILEAVTNTDDGGGAQLLGNRHQARDIKTRLLITAISFYPASLRSLLQFMLKPLSAQEKQLDAQSENQEPHDDITVVSSLQAPSNSLLANVNTRPDSHGTHEIEEQILNALLEGSTDSERDTSEMSKQEITRKLKRRRASYRKRLRHSLGFMRRHFQSLDTKMQDFVLQKAVSNTIRIIPLLTQKKILQQKEDQERRPHTSHAKSSDDETALDTYVRVIDQNLIGPLRVDARISDDILSQVRQIFLALPAGIQARVLLTGIRHVVDEDLRFSQQSPGFTPLIGVQKRDSAVLAKKLLSSGGVVAVKLAQMLAEDPKIPQEYRELLGSLRDSNETMSPSDFWRQLPSSVRDRITSLGKCLGTGSVKQVHIARGDFDDTYVGFLRQPLRDLDDSQPLHDNTVAVGVLRQQVEDEALSSLEALLLSPDLATIASRLARLVYGEFSLFQEGESLKDVAGTPIGIHPFIDVVDVKHNSPRCLVMSVGHGPTASKAMKKFDHDLKRNGREQTDPQVRHIMHLLTQFHETVFEAFVQDGIIHSDVHLGNMIVGELRDRKMRRRPKPQSDNEAGTDNEKLILFDVGQFERISPPETLAILWTLVALSDNTRRRTLKSIAVKHLTGCSTINPAFLHHSDPSDKQAHDGVIKSDSGSHADTKWLRRTLSEAFDAAIEPLSDGTIPDKKLAYMLFLREAEARGASVPKGCFAVAKMIDGIISQQDSFGLYPIFEELAEEFLKSKMTFGEILRIARNYFL